MKKFLKQILNSKFSIFLRERTGIKAPIFLVENERSILSSDLFFWRTDHGFSTIFKASDILKKYYDKDSSLVLLFYDQSGNFLLKRDYNFHYGIIDILINSDLLGMESMGTFVALNVPLEHLDSDVKMSNRCYVGYGKEGAHSMVHGNMIAVKTKPKGTNVDPIRFLKPAVSNKVGKYIYHLQKPKYRSYKMSLIFTNPLKRSIMVKVNKKRYEVSNMGCIYVEVPKSDKYIVIESNFIWPRPLIINEKEQFIDAHHG